MNDYEEHLDHISGCASDQQNAFAWNRLNRRPDDSRLIEYKLGQGYYLVVLSGPEYCPSTDAIMGSRNILHSSHKSRGEALDVLNSLGDMDDINAYILPHLECSPTVSQEDRLNDNEIPF